MTAVRTFTVEEANALLPALRHELELVRESLAVLRKASASLPPGARMDDSASPVSAAALHQLHGAERRLLDLGVELKDVEQGLFDFPSVRDGRPVLLCWREGEPSVEWFHDAAAGFAGRQPLSAPPEPSGLAPLDDADDPEDE